MGNLSKEFDAEEDLGQGFESEQDLAAPEQPAEEHSTLGDFATGIHRGSMMGGAEELAGLGGAIGDKFADTDMFKKMADWYYGQKTGASPEAMEIAASAEEAPSKSFYDTYREGERAAQAETDAAREASPWAFGGGQVLGGLATGIASSPLAAAAPMTTAIGAGALAGGLDSSATIEQPLDLAKDVAKGGAAGFALQKILPGGPKTQKPAKDILQQGELIPQLKTAVKMGEEGVSLSAKPQARQALTQRLQENEQDIANQFINPRKTLGRAVEEPLNSGNVLTQSIDDVDAIRNVEEVLTANAKSLGRGKAAELIEKAQQLQQGLLSAPEAYQFRKELSALGGRISNPEHQQIIQTGLGTIKNVLEESAPGFREATQDFAQFAQKGPEALLSRGFDPEVADVFLGDLSKGNLKISEKVRDLLNTIRSGGPEGLKKQGEFFAAMKQLEELAAENPELVRKIGIDPAKLTRKFIEKADESAVAKKVAGEGVAQAAYERGRFGLRKASESGALKAANMYGQAKRSTKEFVESTTEKLVSAADALRQHGGPDLQAIAEGLASEIPQKRNAAIFSILQLPKAKEILGIGGENK